MDPYVFGPPESGSVRKRYGSGCGSFYPQKKWEKPWFPLFCDFLSLNTDVNVPKLSKLVSLKPLLKRAESGSGSVIQWYGSADPDLFRNGRKSTRRPAQAPVLRIRDVYPGSRIRIRNTGKHETRMLRRPFCWQWLPPPPPFPASWHSSNGLHRLNRVPGFLYSRPNWVPQPLTPRKRVLRSPPPLCPIGETHLL
jgi:hypothetical protein